MKKTLSIFAFMALFSICVSAQTKKDGTPDMRYNANKQMYGNGYTTPGYQTPKTERNYSNGGQFRLQSGYMKSNGTYVAPHIKTTPDNTLYNNYNPKKN
jgi:hypothetical protein